MFNKKSAGRADTFLDEKGYSGLCHIGASHSVLVVLLVDEDVLLVGVDVTFLSLSHDVAERDDVRDECECTDADHHRRVGSHL